MTDITHKHKLEAIAFSSQHSKKRKLNLAVCTAFVLTVVLAGCLLYQVRYSKKTTTVESTQKLSNAETTRSTAVSTQLAADNPQAIIQIYNDLLLTTQDPKQQAAYYTERANYLRDAYLVQYKDMILNDVIQADRLDPTATSARLVQSVATELNDTVTTEKYTKLYTERVDKDARPE